MDGMKKPAKKKPAAKRIAKVPIVDMPPEIAPFQASNIGCPITFKAEDTKPKKRGFWAWLFGE